MSFSTKFLKTKKILLYSITWSLTLNFHHLVRKNLPAKSHFNLHWENFYNMLFFSFKKDLNGQNHSSSDSNHHTKIPLPAKFPISSMGRYARTSHKCWEHGRTWINTWEGLRWGEGKNAVENYLWSILYVSKVASYKPAKACKFTKNELLHTYFSRILARF